MLILFLVDALKSGDRNKIIFLAGTLNLDFLFREKKKNFHYDLVTSELIFFPDCLQMAEFVHIS